MNRQTLLAFIVWAIDIDGFSLPFMKAWEKFQRNAWGMLKTYTDPNDELLYMPKLVGTDPIEFFTDYVLMYAKWHIEANKTSSTPQPDGALYGKYEKEILNYKKL